MPRGHIGMRFRRLRFRHSGKLRCNTRGRVELHRRMGCVRTWFCLDNSFEISPLQITALFDPLTSWYAPFTAF